MADGLLLNETAWRIIETLEVRPARGFIDLAASAHVLPTEARPVLEALTNVGLVVRTVVQDEGSPDGERLALDRDALEKHVKSLTEGATTVDLTA